MPLLYIRLTVLAAVLSLTALISASPASAEEQLEGTGLALDLLSRMDATRDGADAITKEMSLIVLDDVYCLPPDHPNKGDEDRFLQGRLASLSAYQTRFRVLKGKLTNLIANDANALKAVLGKTGANPMEDSAWQAWDVAFQNAKKAIAAKRAELAMKGTKPCRSAPEPTQVAPEPPQVPGVDLPKVEVRNVEIPPVPKRFCSQAEKDAVLAQFYAVAWDFYMNYQDAREYASAIAEALAKGQGNANVLRSMLPAARQNLNVQADRLDQFQKALDAVRRMPVVNCGSPPQTGTTAQPLPQPAYEMFVTPQVPARFCSEEEKRAVIGQLKTALAAAERNYDKANAAVSNFADRLAKGDKSSATNDAFREASAAAANHFKTVQELEAALRRAEAMPVEVCGAQNGKHDDTYLAVAPSFVFGEWQGPRPVYMGFENSLAVQTFAVEGLKTDDGFTGFDAHVTVGLSRASALHMGLNTYDVSFSGAREMVDPLGQRLLFPGVNSAGFSLAGFVPEGTPGGLNVVDRLRYSYNGENTTFYGAYSQACEHGPLTLIGYGGIAHTIANQQQRLDGRIPGYGFGFAYDTSFDTQVTRGMLGTRAIYPVDRVKGLSFNAGATAFLNFADTNGRDSLLLDGIFEERDIGKNEVTFGWTAGVGAEFDVGGATFFANYRYIDDDTTPIAMRQDAGPSHAEFERAQAHVGMLGARVAF